ncbi:sensor histidine kinase [Tahibacter soli]|jgi:nitrogen fixation/metabolism regulation signal transduction histidine kinase|uniref:histidine kinase n=1 Tax=Tahibacter soli TaxID=2983605 RepID=A0A9X4BJA5_9GAMM|nr:ATP-binding protein [Tahibacter soli]MDC8016140.1 ATP-binding protein [Tahibacter soli]
MSAKATDARRGASPVSQLDFFERRIYLGTLAVVVPAGTALVVLLVASPFAREPAAWIALALLAAATLALVRWQFRRVVYPLYSLAALLEALREGDYSLRARRDGVFGSIIYDVNALAEELQRERHRIEETSRMLAKTLEALDCAVFVFDADDRLRLRNSAAQRLFAEDRERLFGRRADELGLAALFDGPSGRLVAHTFPTGAGRYEVSHSALRHDGRQGRLLVVNDVARVLRDEERLAWQRLLRVLGHEVNNSLAPIRSLAETLASLVEIDPPPVDLADDLRAGLEVIGSRAGALARFLSGYSRLARLPAPQRRAADLPQIVEKVARLEQRLCVLVEQGPPVAIDADADQIEQALINLVRNAVEAAPTSGAVRLRWRLDGEYAQIDVEDDGPGPPNSENMFVPFFTTKPGGSGIGLALTKQIADAHDGSIELVARHAPGGTIARLRIPLPRA